MYLEGQVKMVSVHANCHPHLDDNRVHRSTKIELKPWYRRFATHTSINLMQGWIRKTTLV